MEISMSSAARPRAFISYAWESDDHKEWVKQLAERLRRDGVDVLLDQWALAPGDQLPKFMERAIRENDHVLIVCTPRYREKSDDRSGGVGYEGDVMTGEVVASRNHRKFIPILQKGRWLDAAPSWLKGKVYIDLSDNPYSEDHYRDLLSTLYNARASAPPIGPTPSSIRPGRSPTPSSMPSVPIMADQQEPIRITGIIVDEVGRPRNDGSRGSALYAVPFRLSRRPSSVWADVFVETWNRPPRFTSMHRSGIARVVGDKVILDGTTIEEVERYHRDTLKVVVERANQIVAEQEAEARQRAEAKRREQEAHDQRVRERASQIRFDD